MSSNLPDFDKAQYLGEPEAQTAPGFELRGSAWQEAEANRAFHKSLLVGIVCATLGSVAYAAFIIITHINLGLIGIVLGAFIAGAMLHETDGRGGRRYQIAAALLTYLSISFAATLQVLYALHAAGKDISHLNRAGYLFLAMLSIGSPFFRLTKGFQGLIGLLILFFSIQSAWRIAGGKRTNG